MHRDSSRGPWCGDNARGFSLIEVVIALAVVAITIPVMLGMFGFFSHTSADAVNREEAVRAFDSITLYLNASAPDAATGTPLGTSAGTSPGQYFSTILGWATATTPTFIYAYRTLNGSTSSGYLVSLTAPATGTWQGTLMVGQIKPLITTGNVGFLPNATLTATPYTKAYLPLEVAIYGMHSTLAAGQTSLSPAALIDTYPTVVLR